MNAVSSGSSGPVRPTAPTVGPTSRSTEVRITRDRPTNVRPANVRPANVRPAGIRPGRLRPTGLTVLYDSNCPVCRQARRWVEWHRQLVPVRFVPAGSTLATTQFPALDVGSTLVDVTVITDQGAVLRGDRAWIAVLWAVARTRPTAIKLAAGRGRWMFRNVKGATAAIRRLSASQPDRPQGGPAAWPPPSAGAGTPGTGARGTGVPGTGAAGTVCESCRP